MKILVTVKRVVDYNVKIRVKPDGSGVELANVKMSMNPFDEISVEEALRLREAGKADGSGRRLRRSGQGRGNAAHGAGHGRRPRHPGRDRRSGRAARRRQDHQGRGRSRTARAWSSSASRRSTTTRNQTGQMLSALLGWAQGTFASKVEIGDGKANVTREVDGGLQTIEIKLPAVVTTDLRLNEPRYASLPNIMKAKKKPLDKKTPADFGVDTAAAPQGAEDRRAEWPQGRRQGQVGRRTGRQAEERSRRPLRIQKRRLQHGHSSSG